MKLLRPDSFLGKRGLDAHVVEGTYLSLNPSEAFRSQLADLIQKEEKIQITKHLREESGCEWGVAKSWVVHKTYENLQTEPDKFAFPYCGEPLRTPRAKQCRFCRRRRLALTRPYAIVR